MAFLEADEKQHFKRGSIKRIFNSLYVAKSWLIDLILPPKCLSCSALINEAHNICADCWKELHFISEPRCASCGYPFGSEMSHIDFSTIGESLCGACQKKPRIFDKAISALRYDDHSKKMIIGFKHHDKLEYATFFAKLLRQAGTKIFDDIDIIIPVPLHKKRLFKRRFNQSAIVSNILSNYIEKPHEPTILIRSKNTPPQTGNMNKRSKNVQGAFKVVSKYKGKLTGKNILLIDDVFTTGATIENCSKSLKKAGAGKIYVLTIFRVIAPRA